jgi:hypothetical protein
MLALFPVSQQQGKARNAPSAKTYKQTRWLALNVTDLAYLDLWILSQPSVFLRFNIARVDPQDNVFFRAFFNCHRLVLETIRISALLPAPMEAIKPNILLR